MVQRASSLLPWTNKALRDNCVPKAVNVSAYSSVSITPARKCSYQNLRTANCNGHALFYLTYLLFDRLYLLVFNKDLYFKGAQGKPDAWCSVLCYHVSSLPDFFATVLQIMSLSWMKKDCYAKAAVTKTCLDASALEQAQLILKNFPELTSQSAPRNRDCQHSLQHPREKKSDASIWGQGPRSIRPDASLDSKNKRGGHRHRFVRKISTFTRGCNDALTS